MWRGQYNALMTLIMVPALLVAGIVSYATDNWLILIGLIVLYCVWSMGLGMLNLLSKAFRGKPIIYDGRIDADQKGARTNYE